MDEDAPPTSSVNDIVNEYPSTQQGSRRPAFAQVGSTGVVDCTHHG
jgi:hypothetical protein